MKPAITSAFLIAIIFVGGAFLAAGIAIFQVFVWGIDS